MQITAFDYVKDREGRSGSLAKLATLIEKARRQAADAGITSVLFDNGDTFQGSPVSDLMARKPPGSPHPMVTCMKHLGFDAGGLGNHDFDFGLDKLSSYLSQHEMPIICSNLHSDSLPMVRKDAIITRCVTTNTGQTDSLRIGLISSLPNKTALWSRHHVEALAEFSPAVPALREAAKSLRDQGAELIVVLAHMGLALFDEGDDPQNQISDVAALEEVDVIIGGHTHLRFPGPEHESIAEADCASGKVKGKPVVQPGPCAADLGIIDVVLHKSPDTNQWRMIDAHVELTGVSKQTPAKADIIAVAEAAHSETRNYLAQPVAHVPHKMTSFFALAKPSPVPALLAAAKFYAIERAVSGQQYSDLPLLAVASAPLTGGFDGPDNFIDISGGQIKRQHVAGMNPYANHVWAVKTTGGQLLDWLERSALIFNTLLPDTPDQMLVNPRIPGFRYDAIYGLSYQIDPSVPSCYDTSGRRIAGRQGRIRNLLWQGQPLQHDQQFLVATTDHRASGGGLYKTFSSEDIVIQGHAPMQEAVLEYLRAPVAGAMQTLSPWSFVPNLNRQAVLLTAPEAEKHFDEVVAFQPEPLGETEEGFLKVRLHL